MSSKKKVHHCLKNTQNSFDEDLWTTNGSLISHLPLNCTKIIIEKIDNIICTFMHTAYLQNSIISKESTKQTSYIELYTEDFNFKYFVYPN